ncbi:hypothetical protein [Rufibacter tibetensis]|uniref:Uncharacterized protein n=1 Tax=Rufibacter tibetensis TaxID=512763 RepID=A0A0P0C9J4_9BACT|nr:hypothetical protein [Rufibacter tibetensis]ALI98106.1 hypothetical protein DC20_02830 [Rufibacter tibetensis]
MKNVIVANWNGTGDIEVFSSLKGFLEYYPHYNEYTITNYLSRKKVPYVTEKLTLTRVSFNRRKAL